MRAVAAIDDYVPPHNDEAEMSAIGSMILSERAAEEVFSMLAEEDFYRPSHREIYRAMRQLRLNRSTIDLVTLKNELLQRDVLQQVGGVEMLIQIAESAPSAANATYYAQIVLDLSTMRQLAEAGHEIAKIAHDAELDADEKVDQAEQEVFKVGRQRIGKYFVPVRVLAGEFFDDVDRLMDTGEPVLGVASGFYDLDGMTTGFYGGELYILAARPAMGKTSLVLSFGLNAAMKTKQNVAIFSLEMSGKQLVRRMVSMLSGVGMGALKRPRLLSEEYDKLADATEALYGAPIHVDDSSDVSVLEMRGKCRRLKADGGLAMVIVDYLQLMRGSRRTENRVQEVSEIARGLKALSKELDVPVVALSQLSRQVENRDDKRPQLSDIRESGSIEAEADMVMFIYRDAYYKAKEIQSDVPYDPSRTEESEIIIAKHRNGPTGKVILGFQPGYARFVNYTKEDRAAIAGA
ncbi:MAG: Replicative DNA helicase [Fimbriimonadaceae bacterium]|nr:Replicative DNA helicase [Fimbriimonadaceae bacterium]